MNRAIKVQVVVQNEWNRKKSYKPKVCTNKFVALGWIKSVGWGHVSSGLCEYQKCMSAKVFIDNQQIMLEGNKPILNPAFKNPTFKTHYFPPAKYNPYKVV